jgi:hypothetical protein
MAFSVPSQEQVMAQLRILIPACATAITAFGVNATKAGSYEQVALACLAPISYLIVAVWSLVANTRINIIASAAKSIEPGIIPAPQIIMPAQESHIADALPANVTAAPPTLLTPLTAGETK